MNLHIPKVHHLDELQQLKFFCFSCNYFIPPVINIISPLMYSDFFEHKNTVKSATSLDVANLPDLFFLVYF